jgi:hypothetical protein
LLTLGLLGAQCLVGTTTASAASRPLSAGVPYAAPTDPVRIASIKLSAYNVRAGDWVFARVVTTSNAAALTARVGKVQVSVPRIAPGIFAARIQVPRVLVPGHRVNIIVTAIRADGAKAERVVSVNVYLF